MGKVAFHSLAVAVVQGIIENENFPPLVWTPNAQWFNLI